MVDGLGPAAKGGFVIPEAELARRTYFSFHYKPDVWRAWNVRNSWVVKPEDQVAIGFFDSRVFEASQRDSDDPRKSSLRKGLENTSVTCVLAGAATWTRRWVRYEIARSLLKGNGLLTVYIDGVKNKDQVITSRGANPLAQMGVYKGGNGIFLAEWKGGKWVRYSDYPLAILGKDLWFAAPTTTDVVQLSRHSMSYDYTAQNGRHTIGGWDETAAGLAGR